MKPIEGDSITETVSEIRHGAVTERWTRSYFELWDGGHCFVRVLYGPKGQFFFYRWPQGVNANWLEWLAIWARAVSE